MCARCSARGRALALAAAFVLVVGFGGAGCDDRSSAPADARADDGSLVDARDAGPPDTSGEGGAVDGAPDGADAGGDLRPDAAQPLRLLVFSRTQAFRHGSIGAGVNLLKSIAGQRGWLIDATEDATQFTAQNLARYRAVIWLNTSGDVLDAAQQSAFEGYIKSGGAYVGVHAASDTEYGWPWYGQLVGAYFKRHPQVQGATLRAQSNNHPASAALPDPWMRTDEWYDFQSNPRPNVTVLLTIDESSYSGGGMGADHPIAWAHTFDGGRAFYTAMGHTNGTYSEPDFIAHLSAGIAWAAGVAP